MLLIERAQIVFMIKSLSRKLLEFSQAPPVVLVWRHIYNQLQLFLRSDLFESIDTGARKRQPGQCA